MGAGIGVGECPSRFLGRGVLSARDIRNQQPERKTARLRSRRLIFGATRDQQSEGKGAGEEVIVPAREECESGQARRNSPNGRKTVVKFCIP